MNTTTSSNLTADECEKAIELTEVVKKDVRALQERIEDLKQSARLYLLVVIGSFVISFSVYKSLANVGSDSLYLMSFFPVFMIIALFASVKFFNDKKMITRLTQDRGVDEAVLRDLSLLLHEVEQQTLPGDESQTLAKALLKTKLKRATQHCGNA